MAARAASYHEFSLAAFDGASNLRAGGQHLQGLQNLRDAFGGAADIEPGDVVEEAVKVVENFWRNLDAGHEA
jgi:hypothetical protein